MDDLGLYGCGAVGVDAAVCERMVVTNTHIYDCSAYGVRLADTKSTRFEYCRFYCIGDRASYAHAFLYLTKVTTAEFYSCTFTDSYVQSLVVETVSQGIDLSQLQFENNTAINSMLDFHSSSHPVVMDKCTFKDNTFVSWYGTEQFPAVNRKGDKLTAEDLNTENVILEPEYPPMTEVHVSNVDQFLKAIAPNTAIILEAKEYDLSKAKDYGKGSSEYYSWYEGPDGPELYINIVSNFSITGQGRDATTISAVPRHANVLNFTSCSNITIADLTAGHTREPGSCSGGVLNFVSCSQIAVDKCGLYGCGVYGVTTKYVEQIIITDCEIYECSEGGARFGNTNGITIKHTVFRDLGGYALQYDGICSGVVLEGNTIPEVDIPTHIPPLYDEVITSAELRYANSPLSEFTEAVGHDTKLTLHYEPKDLSVTNSDVRWVTTDNSVASVRGDTKGCTITCESEGEATITCKMFGIPVCSVRVYVRESW